MGHRYLSGESETPPPSAGKKFAADSDRVSRFSAAKEPNEDAERAGMYRLGRGIRDLIRRQDRERYEGEEYEEKILEASFTSSDQSLCESSKRQRDR